MEVLPKQEVLDHEIKKSSVNFSRRYMSGRARVFTVVRNGYRIGNMV